MTIHCDLYIGNRISILNMRFWFLTRPVWLSTEHQRGIFELPNFLSADEDELGRLPSDDDADEPLDEEDVDTGIRLLLGFGFGPRTKLPFGHCYRYTQT